MISPVIPVAGSTWESTTKHGHGPIWRVRVLEVYVNEMIRAEIISTNFATGLQTPPGTEIRSSVKTLRTYGRPYSEAAPPAATP